MQMSKEPVGVQSAKITARAVIVAACIALVGPVFALLINHACSKEKQGCDQAVSGSRNIVANGEQVTINVSGDTVVSKPDSLSARLKVVDSVFTHDGAFDIKLLNTCNTACFVTRIDVTCLREHNAWVKMPVHPSAKYVIPVDGIKTGETRSLDVSFSVPPKSPERFLLYVNSGQMHTLCVALCYNTDQVVCFTNNTWDMHALPSRSEQLTSEEVDASAKYVLWDGHDEVPYVETNRIHDCIYLSDGMVSCQELRREYLRLGFVCTMFFGCGSGQVAVTSTNGSVFTQAFFAVLKSNPQVTIRDAVCRVNQSMHAQGIDQKCEVITRRDVLDLPYASSSVKDKIHVCCIYDMCRTPIPETERKNFKWHRINAGSLGPLSHKN